MENYETLIARSEPVPDAMRREDESPASSIPAAPPAAPRE